MVFVCRWQVVPAIKFQIKALETSRTSNEKKLLVHVQPVVLKDRSAKLCTIVLNFLQTLTNHPNMCCQFVHILLRESNIKSGKIHFAASQMNNVLAVEG